MAQSGWRLPDDLLKRVRVRCAEEGVRQNAWVERALESALGSSAVDSVVPSGGGQRPAAPSRASEPYKLPPSAPTPKPAVVPSRQSSKVSAVPGVRPAREFVLDPRQAALNKAKGS